MKLYTDEDIQKIHQNQNDNKHRLELKAARMRIMEGLEKISNRSGERAIWELTQNARDFSKKEPAIIRISLSNETLSFSHQAEPFNQDTLTALIKQQSTKPGEEETIGRYGTGFMATHTFSRLVYIQGDCRVVDQDGDNVYVTLRDGFCLDRRSDNEEVFIKKLDDELNEVDNLIDRIREGHDEPQKWTTFVYPIEQEEKAKKISAQIATAMKLMPYVLAFNDNIAQFEVIDDIRGESARIFKNNRTGSIMQYDSNVKRFSNEICLQQGEDNIYMTIHTLESSNGKDRIVIPPLPPYSCNVNEIPSHFISFPMLGSEHFGTNFIIHSERLHPTEQRESFLLPKDSDAVIAKCNHNKKVIEEILQVLFDYYEHNPLEQKIPIEFAEVAFNPDSQKDPITRNYLQTLQDKFIDKFIHWKMIPTEKGFLSIQDDQNFSVLSHDIYLGHSDSFINEHLPALVSYASTVSTIPSENIIEWSRIVYGWKPQADGYYLSIDEICEKISDNGENLKSFLLLLKELGEKGREMLKKHSIIPNREGKLCRSGDLKDAKSITEELYAIAKPILGDQAQKLVNPDFADFVIDSSKYDRKSLRDDIRQEIDELRKNTIKRKSNYDYPNISLSEASLNVKLSDLITFCSAFPNSGTNSQRAKLLPLICRIYGQDYSPRVIPPVSDDEVDFYSVAYNYLIDNTLFDLSKKPTSWFKEEDPGKERLNLLHEFLSVYTKINDQDYLRKLDEYGIFPNRNLVLCLPKELKKSETEPFSEKILDLYSELAPIVNCQIKDFRDILVHEDFDAFYNFKICETHEISDKMEAMIRELDKDYSSEKTRKIVLDIIEGIDKEEWHDNNIFRDIRMMKPTIFFKNAVSGEKGKHVYSLMKQDDSVIEDLATLAEEPNFMNIISTAKNILIERQQEESDFQFKKELGNHIESILRKKLSFVLNYSAEDFLFQVDDVQKGQDIIISYKNKPIYLIEVKTKWNFTTSGPAYMSRNQVLKACENSDHYALCCVDLTDKTLPERTYPERIDDILDKVRFRFNIGSSLEILMKPTLDASKNPEENISIDGDFKARIPAKIFRSGDSFDTLIDKILEKAALQQ